MMQMTPILARDRLPTETDCDINGRVMVFDDSFGFWATSKLSRAVDLLKHDERINYWMPLPGRPDESDPT